MRRLVLAIATLCAFSFSLCLAATQQNSSSSAPQDQPKQDTDKDKDKKDKKKKDKAKAQDPYDSVVFSQAVANNVLNDLRDGLEGHSQRLVLSAFDQDKLDGYL